jgi:carbonic anhydrase
MDIGAFWGRSALTESQNIGRKDLTMMHQAGRTPHPGDAMACSCCAGPYRAALAVPLGRRGLLRGVAAGAALLTLGPRLGLAAEGNYEAMILACIDPRFQEPVRAYAQKNGLIGKYSQFIFAGAAIGVVAPKFADWHKAFWGNLATSVELHKVKKVIAINHRDCGAAKIAYGDASIATPEKENQTHRAALAEFRKQVRQHQPKLAVETGLMALDGSMMMFS